MSFDRAPPDYHSLPITHVQSELIERLHAFGLIEPNGNGGWRLTDCGRSGLAVVQDHHAENVPSKMQLAVVGSWRGWTPRSL